MALIAWHAERASCWRIVRVDFIGAKLGLGIGVLLVLCVVIGLVSYTQTNAVNDKLEELTQVREPVNSAVYAIENDLAETAFATLAYSATGDRRLLGALERKPEELDSSRKEETGVVELARFARLRQDLQDSIVSFHDAALEQVRLRDVQVQGSELRCVMSSRQSTHCCQTVFSVPLA